MVTFSREEAEAIAASALGFIAERPETLGRFLALTGVDSATLRRSAGEPDFLAGVIAYLLSEEELLVAFAETAGLQPDRIGEVERTLNEADNNHEHNSAQA